MIEKVAQQVARSGLTTPAIFFLEMNRPFTFAGSQFMHFLSPFASIFGMSFWGDMALLFEERANIDRLLNRLEELSEGPQRN